MKLVGCYEEYKEKVNEVRKGGCISNCYFLVEQVKALIENKKLYMEECGSNIYFYEKEASFFRFYYYIKEKKDISLLLQNEPVVVEFVFNNQLTEKQKHELELVKGFGFELGRESGRMSMLAKDVKIFQGLDENEGIKIDYAKQSDAEKIISLLNDNFDPLYAYLPEEDEMKKMIEQKVILAIYQNGTLAGILNMDLNKKNVWIRHLVIDKSFRGKGFGKVLLNQYHILMKDKVDCFMHWVDLNNQAAINMYIKAGYKLDGRKANEYVCR